MGSIAKTYYLHFLTEKQDITWDFIPFLISSSIETAVVIVAASAPALSPIFRSRKRIIIDATPEYELSEPAAFQQHRLSDGTTSISKDEVAKSSIVSTCQYVDSERDCGRVPSADDIHRTCEVTIAHASVDENGSSTSGRETRALS